MAAYLQNIQFKKFTIRSACGSGITAEMGQDIKGILAFDITESIFSPTFNVSAKLIATEGIFSDLKLHGTERATIELVHSSLDESLIFEDLIITNMRLDDTTSTGSIFTIVLHSEDLIKNEKSRLSKRYDNTINSSVHVTSILENNITTKYDLDDGDIETTANTDGFYGNYWTPYRAIYWLARRALSGSMSKDGGGTHRAGFLFWQTKTGYRFKSIDTIMSKGVTERYSGDTGGKEKLVYIQNEVIDPETISENYSIFHPTFEKDNDVVSQMRTSRFGEDRVYVNLHSLYTTKRGDDMLSETNVSDSQDSLGDEDDLCMEFDIRNVPSRPTVMVVADGTMRKDGSIDNTGNGEFNPHKVVSQSRMRYQSLLSKSLKITTPMNLQIESGDVIEVNIIKSSSGTDDYVSGQYIVKDLRHTYSLIDGGTVECLTVMRLTRDWHGKKSNATGSMDLSVGYDAFTESYTA